MIGSVDTYLIEHHSYPIYFLSWPTLTKHRFQDTHFQHQDVFVKDSNPTKLGRGSKEINYNDKNLQRLQ